MYKDIDYSQGLFFKNTDERSKALEILKANNIEVESETCFMAAMNTEVEEQLKKTTVTERQFNVINSMLSNVDLWETLETSVSQAIDFAIQDF